MESRSSPRLPGWDYAKNGVYFLTLCAKDRCRIFARVGRGLAPADPTPVFLTPFGKIAVQQISALEKRFSCLKIDYFVIMPNHIHILLTIREQAAGASPRPTVSQIIGAYKSLVTRECGRMMGVPGQKIWQTSFHDHIIRNDADFLAHWNYIDANPAQWAEDEYYTEEKTEKEK